MVIGRYAVTGDFREDFSSALLSAGPFFQRKYRRTFPQHHPGSVGVERTALIWRCRLKRIEADENQFAQRVVSACQYPLVPSRTDAMKRMADRVRSRRAGVRDHLAGT